MSVNGSWGVMGACPGAACFRGPTALFGSFNQARAACRAASTHVFSRQVAEHLLI